MKPHLMIKEEIMVVDIEVVWTNNIKKDVLKYSPKKEYYTLPPEVELLTINFVDSENQTDSEDHRKSHELFWYPK